MDFWICFWTFLVGLSLECLWTAWNGFSVSLIGFPQPFFVSVCVGRSRKPWPTERWKSSTSGLLLIAYLMGILSGIFLAFCSLKFCKGRNTTANNSNSQELTVDEKAGDVFFWTITWQMYHIREKCPFHTATWMGRTARSCDVCQVCNPDFGAPVTVTSTGWKYHCRDCRTISKSTPVELIRCPICFDVKAE